MVLREIRNTIRATIIDIVCRSIKKRIFLHWYTKQSNIGKVQERGIDRLL